MSRLFVLLAFCSIFTTVFSDNDGTNCIFDWKRFRPLTSSKSTVVDASEQKISVLNEGSKTYHYLTGPLKINAWLDNSYDAYYRLQKLTDDGVKNIVRDVAKACYYFENIRPMYFLPVTGTHNDFPRDASLCPMQPGTLHLYPVNNSSELTAPSKLENGRYIMIVSFLKNSKKVGGISGVFDVLRN